ncbi:hypothetical protein FGO68_gene13519 [Halteria grandinella]|uniref:Uncharacterized protein n=1 Tax=Halteria grandinella TaxID=5974 RepID=A0A8J8NTR9_HALGN|nr:hypothetical protein FGO68_gene13519 [Halteria grandinella]
MQGLDTNLSAKDHLLLSQLPLMERSFQERMHFFTAANNISANVAEFNENIAVRFLGYDSILQFTLLAKLFMFMMLFGMSAQGVSRWFIIVLLIFYYFHRVRTLYIEHYDRQRRLLNIGNQNEQDGAQGGNEANLEPWQRGLFGRVLGFQPQGEVPQQPIPSWQRVLRVIVVLIVHFFLSINHDWIERRLRLYERQRAQRRAQNEAVAGNANVAQPDQAQQLQPEANQPAQNPNPKAVDDDILFKIEGDNLNTPQLFETKGQESEVVEVKQEEKQGDVLFNLQTVQEEITIQEERLSESQRTIDEQEIHLKQD